MAEVIVAGTPGGYAALCLSCIGNGGGALFLTDGPVKEDTAYRVAARHRRTHTTPVVDSEPECTCVCTCGAGR